MIVTNSNTRLFVAERVIGPPDELRFHPIVAWRMESVGPDVADIAPIPIIYDTAVDTSYDAYAIYDRSVGAWYIAETLTSGCGEDTCIEQLREAEDYAKDRKQKRAEKLGVKKAQ